MYDIKQIANFDFNSSPITSFYTITDTSHTITIGGNIILEDFPYKRITFNKDIPKFGYCCEPKALSYPIFINSKGNNEFKEFQIGKTGMFEIQPETWYDINDDESYEQETEVLVSGIDIPYGFNFKFDYIYPDN